MTLRRSSYRWFQAETFARVAAKSFAALFTLGYGGLGLVTFFVSGLDWIKVPAMVGYALAIAAISLARGALATFGLRELAIQLGEDREIRLVVGDLFHNLRRFPEASCVFGVNDQLDVTDLLAGSAHAAFLRTYFAGQDHAANQAQLDDAARAIGLSVHPLSTPDGPARPHQRFGTVVAVPFGDATSDAQRRAFLLVNSSRDHHGFSGRGQSADLIGKVWRYHEEHGVTSPQLVCSLVGTGASSDLGPMGSLFHIVDEYFRHLERTAARDLHIRRLVVSIPERALTSGKVDLRCAREYVAARAAIQRAMA